MARHAFSRRSRRRKRTGAGALRGLRFSDVPFIEFVDEGIRIAPRFQKVIGKSILRASLGRRITEFRLLDPEPRFGARFFEAEPDPHTQIMGELEQRRRSLGLADASVDNTAKHRA